MHIEHTHHRWQVLLELVVPSDRLVGRLGIAAKGTCAQEKTAAQQGAWQNAPSAINVAWVYGLFLADNH